MTGRRVFFLETLGAASAKEVATDMGDILAFSEADRLEAELLWLSEVTGVSEAAWGGFEGFFFVTSS